MMPTGKSPLTEQEINSEKVLMKQKKRVSIHNAASSLEIFHWKVLEDPQGPPEVGSLQTKDYEDTETEDRQEQRRNACIFFASKA